MLNHAKEQIASRKLSRDAFVNEEGAIDLASIMVGIIVIGIIGGVIAATVFAVIPWSQDNAAKSALGSIDTAQSAHAGFAAEKGQPLYVNLAGLESDKLLAKSANKLTATAYDSGKCYVSTSKSDSGKTFWKDSINNKIQELTGSSTSSCGTLPGATPPAAASEKGTVGYPEVRYANINAGDYTIIGYAGFLDMEGANAGTPAAYGNIPALAQFEGQKSKSISLPISSIYIVTPDGTKTSYTGTGNYKANINASGIVYDHDIRATDYFAGKYIAIPDGSYIHFIINGVDQKLKFQNFDT